MFKYAPTLCIVIGSWNKNVRFIRRIKTKKKQDIVYNILLIFIGMKVERGIHYDLLVSFSVYSFNSMLRLFMTVEKSLSKTETAYRSVFTISQL